MPEPGARQRRLELGQSNFGASGGVKRSLFGDHDMHGPERVPFYTKQKALTSRRPTGIRAGAAFKMPTMG